MHYELEMAAREAVWSWFGDTYWISYPNTEFTPPADGSPWLKFDYIEALTQTVSLDRKCRVYVGIVQVSVFFSPGTGTSIAKNIAQGVAKRAADGIMLSMTDDNGLNPVEVGCILEAGELKRVVKKDTGWMIPVQFTVRAESREGE